MLLMNASSQAGSVTQLLFSSFCVFECVCMCVCVPSPSPLSRFPAPHPLSLSSPISFLPLPRFPAPRHLFAVELTWGWLAKGTAGFEVASCAVRMLSVALVSS